MSINLILIFKFHHTFHMILQQNYIKIAQYTQKAFRIYCKRSLGNTIVNILQKRSAKDRDKIGQEHEQNKMQFSHNHNRSTLSDKKALGIEPAQENLDIESVSSDLRRNQSATDKQEFHSDQTSTKQELYRVGYGSLVYLECVIEQSKSIFRMMSFLNNIKLCNLNKIGDGMAENSRCIFELCHPAAEFFDLPETLDSSNLICLRNVSKNKYLKITNNIALTMEFGYELELVDEIDQAAIFVIENYFDGDEPIITGTYYEFKLYTEEKYLKMYNDTNDFGIFCSLKGSKIRLIKVHEHLRNIMNPYIYIKNKKISNFFRASELNFSSLKTKQTYSNIVIQTELESYKESGSFILNKFDFSKKPEQEIKISPQKKQDAMYCWQIQEIHKAQKNSWRLFHPILGQGVCVKGTKSQIRLSQNPRDFAQLSINQQNQNVTISVLNKNFEVKYDPQSEKYCLSTVKTDLNNSITVESESQIFQFIPVNIKKSKTIMSLLEILEALHENYLFFYEWGFIIDKNEETITYSTKQIKLSLSILRKKLKEMRSILKKLKDQLENPEAEISQIQMMAKEMKIFEMLIENCKLLVTKIGKKEEKQKDSTSPYEYARTHFIGLLHSIFSVILDLIKDNKNSSNIIITQAHFFNKVLIQFPEKVGEILQEAIKNLSIFTTKAISNEHSELFQWINLIEPIAEETVRIQKTYIDIIAEVVVDPQDNGIVGYQNKCKELLFVQRSSKKKLIPRFGLDRDQKPVIIFQNEANMKMFLQKNPTLKKLLLSPHSSTSFFVETFFSDKQAFEQYIDYITSVIKLFRNLCKDRNKKLMKIVEDWGLSQSHIYSILNSRKIGWQLKIMYMNLWISVFLDQDPFLPFSKRQTKCHSWKKISSYDFTQNIAIIFKQFTDESKAIEKLNEFSWKIQPFIERFFFEMKEKDFFQESQYQCFTMVLNSIYQMMNFGYLTLKMMKNYIGTSLNLILKNINQNKMGKKKRFIIKEIQDNIKSVIEVLKLYEAFWVQIYGMKFIKEYCIVFSNKTFSFKPETNREKWNQILTNQFQQSEVLVPQVRKRTLIMEGNRKQVTVTGSKFNGTFQELNQLIDNFIADILCSRVINQKTKAYCGLVQLASAKVRRKQKIAEYLKSIIILSNDLDEKIYSDFNGRQSGKLLNWLKIQELVTKIKRWETNDCPDSEEEKRKKEKILELNNILLKIVRQMNSYKTQHKNLFTKCQQILQKLQIHTMLLQILLYSDKQSYFDLIKTVHKFILEFIEDNERNLLIISSHISNFVISFNYPCLPIIIPKLFENIDEKKKIIIFQQICRWIYKKNQAESSRILLQTIYYLIKYTKEPKIFKEKLVFYLTNYQKTEDLLKEKATFAFINVLCEIAKDYSRFSEKIKNYYPKVNLIKVLMSQQSYEKKKISIKILLEFYIQQKRVENFEIEAYINGFILKELKKLPSLCIKFIENLKTINKQEANEIQRCFEDVENDFKGKKMELGEQQNYFTYILDSENQSEASLLSFAQTIGMKWNEKSEQLHEHENQEFLKYIGKIWKFLYLIIIQNSSRYQRKMLWKIQKIGILFQNKLNKKLNFGIIKKQSDEEKNNIKEFFFSLAQFLFEEKISFKIIIDSFSVSSKKLIEKRSGYENEFYINEDQFDKCLSKLAGFIKRKSQFDKIIEGKKVCRFFNYFKDSEKRKANIYGFIEKLINSIEHLRNLRIKNDFKSNEKNEERDDMFNFRQIFVYSESQSIGQNQLFIQIDQFCQTKINENMENCIKNQIYETIQRLDENIIMGWMKTQSTSLIKVHGIYNDSVIMDWIAYFIFEKVGSALSNQGLKEYLHFLFIKLKETLSQDILKLIKVSINLYYSTLQSSIENIVLKIFDFLLQICQNNKSSQNLRLFELNENIICWMLHQENCSLEFKEEIQDKVAKTILKWCERSDKFDYFSCDFLKKIIEICVKGLDDCDALAKSLAKNDKFRNFLKYLFCQRKNSQILSVNQSAKLKNTLCSSFIKLITKFHFKKYEPELKELLSDFHLQSNFQMSETLYKDFILVKILDHEEERFCENQQQCSEMFCNYGKFTKNDDFMITFLIQFLILLQISTQTKSLQENRQNLSSEFMFTKIVGSINLRLKNHMLTNYFFRKPFLRRFLCEQIKYTIKVQLEKIRKQQLYKHLHSLSELFEMELQTHCFYHKNLITKFLLLYRKLLTIFKFLILILSMILKIHTTDLTGLILAFISFALVMNTFYFVRDFQTYLHRIKYYCWGKMEEKAVFSFHLKFFLKSNLIMKFSVIVLYIISFFNYKLLSILFLCELLALESFKRIFCLYSTSMIQNFRYIALASLTVLIGILNIYLMDNSAVSFRSFLSQILFQLYVLGFSRQRITEQRNFMYINKHPLFFIMVSIEFWLFFIYFIAWIAKQLLKKEETDKSSKNQCMICLRSKDNLQANGIKISRHFKDEHNIWNYLYFFLSIKKSEFEEGTEMYAKSCIMKGDYSFLKLHDKQK